MQYAHHEAVWENEQRQVVAVHIELVCQFDAVHLTDERAILGHENCLKGVYHFVVNSFGTD